MSDYHEEWSALPEAARNVHRAVRTALEELEAIDWYHERAVLCQDPSLRSVIEHARDEEIEHCCLALEWLRRNVPEWDRKMRAFLFTAGPIVKEEGGEGSDVSGALGIGSLKEG